MKAFMKGHILYLSVSSAAPERTPVSSPQATPPYLAQSFQKSLNLFGAKAVYLAVL
jgi:hypothetical protein